MLVEVLIGKPSGGLGVEPASGAAFVPPFASASGAGTSRQVRHSPCTAACEMSEANPSDSSSRATSSSATVSGASPTQPHPRQTTWRWVACSARW